MGEVALFAKSVFLPYKKVAQKRPPKLTLQDLKYPPEVRVELETCSTIRRTPVQAIFDKNIAKGTMDPRVKFSLPK